MYKNRLIHKTDTIGEIIVIISNGDSEISSTFNFIKKVTDWKFEDKNFRLIVPNNLLSDIKPFIAVAIERELKTFSTDLNQYIYYVEDLGEVSMMTALFPQIINESKPF